jgi:methyl-accepting chemotaxis protein
VEVFKAHAVERHKLQAEEQANAERAVAERHDMMLSVATGFESTVVEVVQGVTTAATRDEVASQVARAATTAQEATAATQRTEATVRDVTDAAQRIGDVVGLIHGIANQTNLLALNATIEAARAGDSGKGFAVVASEVKNLATQTAKATDDIAAQISAMQSSTQQAVAAIGGIGGVVEPMDRIVGGDLCRGRTPTICRAGDRVRCAGGGGRDSGDQPEYRRRERGCAGFGQGRERCAGRGT